MVLYPAGVVQPHNLNMLARVCVSLCKAINIPTKSSAGERLAEHVLALSLNGLRDERELVETMLHRQRNRMH